MKRLRISTAAIRRLAEAGLTIGAIAFGVPLDAYGIEAYIAAGGLKTIRLKGERF